MEYNLDHFKSELSRLEIDLSEKQIEQFLHYYEMLIEKNKVMNLTAITDFDEVIEKHFIDSLSLVKVMDLNKDISVIDLGTGAGFPGIPLKITFPNLKIVLADSLNKRVLFLNDVIRELGLERIEAIHGRAEDLARNPLYREQFDLVVSRAVANLSTLSEYCLPFTNVGGYFVSYKSGEVDDELETAKKAISILGGRPSEVEKFVLGDSKRSFVCVEKVKNTPNKFPRKAGTPKNEPIS